MALMRDELGERSEMPTPFRLAEARRRGHVARSGDLVSAAVLLGGLGALAGFGGGLLAALKGMTAEFLSPALPGRGIAATLRPILKAVAPLLLAPPAAAVLASLIQTGPLVSSDPVKPNIGRISPAAGLRRAFSRRSLARIVLALAKIATVVAVCLLAARPLAGRIMRTAAHHPDELAGQAGWLTLGLALPVAAALLAVGIVDWLYQRWQYRQDLKITRRELTDDLRMMEGQAGLAGRRREARHLGQSTLRTQTEMRGEE